MNLLNVLVLAGANAGFVVCTDTPTVELFYNPNPTTAIKTQRHYYVREVLCSDGRQCYPAYVPHNWLREATQQDLRIAYSRLVLFYELGLNTFEMETTQGEFDELTR